MNTICCWDAFKAVWWKQSTHANHANPLICSVCLVLSPMISARCQRCVRRGWQTSRGRCLDYLATQTWQVAVSVSVHVILRLRDSASSLLFHISPCPKSNPLRHLLPKLDFPLMVPRGCLVDFHIRCCVQLKVRVNALLFIWMPVSWQQVVGSQASQAEGEEEEEE